MLRQKVIMIGLTTGAAVGACPQPDAAADVAYITYEFKNESNQTANDFHLVLRNLDHVGEPVSKARSQSFGDPPQGEGTNTLDWLSTSGGSVLPGGKDRIGVCNEDFDVLPAAVHFTFDGNELATRWIKVFGEWKIDEDGELSYSVENRDPSAIIIHNLMLFVDNELANFDLGDESNPYETPSGSKVLNVSGIILQPGEQMVWEVGVHDVLSNYVLGLMMVAPQDDPGDQYFFAARFSAVPAPGALPLLAVALGSARSRRRRR